MRQGGPTHYIAGADSLVLPLLWIASRLISLLDKLMDPDFDSKYGEEADRHAKENSAWIMKGMQDDAAKGASNK